MNPSPLHIRTIRDVKEDSVRVYYRVYIHGNFISEVDSLSIADLCKLFAHVYGMPISADTRKGDEEQPEVLTADHLIEKETVVFDAVDYPSFVLEDMTNQLMSRAIVLKIIEAAKVAGVPLNALKGAVRIANDPNAPGVQRLYAVQRNINPQYAQFVGYTAFTPGSNGAEFILGDIELHEGHFGRGGIEAGNADSV